jgi:hypothetical protein
VVGNVLFSKGRILMQTTINARISPRFTLLFRARLMRDLIAERFGRGLGEVTLANYGAMYRERYRSMEEAQIHPENLEIITGNRIKTAGDLEDIKNRSKDIFTDSSLVNPLTYHAHACDLIYKTIPQYPIKTAVNIGAFVDNISSYLAGKFPSIQFTSVDGYDDLEKINSFLPQHPNWDFMSGYALEMLESGRIKADCFYTNSTTVNFTYKELDRYLAAMARSAKLVIFVEPWWPNVASWSFSLPRPEDIDPTKPLLGVSYLSYHHNYPHYLKKHGFEIVMSRVVAFRGTARLQIIATHPG